MQKSLRIHENRKDQYEMFLAIFHKSLKLQRCTSPFWKGSFIANNFLNCKKQFLLPKVPKIPFRFYFTAVSIRNLVHCTLKSFQ